jgi:hypothetical protein
VTVLGATALSVGIIEGVAEATTSIAKVFGAVSDWIGKRKPLVLLGYVSPSDQTAPSGSAAVFKPAAARACFRVEFSPPHLA